MSPEEWLKQQQARPSRATYLEVHLGTATPEPTLPEVTVTAPAMTPEEWLAQTEQPATEEAPTEVPETTLQGLVGAATRGLAPVATGAALGAAAGAPLAGVGAIPGAIAGAGAAALTQLVGDPIVSTVNSLLGTKYTLPTQAMEDMLTRLGVAQPKTEAERIVQSTVAGAAGAGGTAAAGRAVMSAAGTAAPVTREVARQIAAQPATQIAGGAGAGAVSQAAQEAGFGPVGQTVAGIAGGMAGARAVAPRTPIQQLPSDLEEAQRAGIKVMTSDVVPPRTFAQKWMRVVGERIPVAGTGPVREVQQTQRIQAVKDLAQDFGVTDPQVLSKSIWDDLAAKRGTDVLKYKSMKDQVIDEISTAQSNRVLGEQMLREADELTQKAGQLYAQQGKLLNRANALQRLGQTPAAQERMQRFDQRVNEYRAAIEEAQRAAVEKRQLAQVMIQDVSGPTVAMPKTLATIDDQIGKLESMNNVQVRPVINILKDWNASIQGQDLKNIELLRTQLGQAFKDPQLGAVRTIGEKAVSAIYKPMVDDMGEFIKANGGTREYTKWKLANTRLAGMMDDVNGTVLGSVLKTGEATPEDVNKLLFSTKPSEVARLYRGLTEDGRANARAAIIARAVEKSGGLDHVSPDRFANQIKSLGKSVNIFFSGDDLRRVQGLARVLNLTKRAGEAAALPQTGVQNFYAMLGIGGAGAGATQSIGGALTTLAGAAAVGGMARVYESAPVRNMLMKIPQTRPGSAEEAELVKRLMAALAAQQQVQTPTEKE